MPGTAELPPHWLVFFAMVSVPEINLCETCAQAHENPLFDNAAQLVYPEDGTPAAGGMNTRSESVCPACGALWVREQSKTRLGAGS